MKILCLFIRHGTAAYPKALTLLDRWYENHGLIDQRTLWVIDNQLPPEMAPQLLGNGATLHAGDNRAWEFTAWERALREVRQDKTDYDIVHFVTSAFNTLYTGYLEHFHKAMLDYVIERNVCLGHIDSYDRPVGLAGRFSAAWIRTCFFFLPLALARRIEPWAAFTETSQFFAAPTTTPFRDDAPLSVDYQERVRVWLEGQEVGGHTWHSPILSGEAEAARFQRKTLAIVNEHNLSITLRRQEIPLVDFCWLNSRRGTPVSSIEDPPKEAVQLKVRRCILGIPEPAL